MVATQLSKLILGLWYPQLEFLDTSFAAIWFSPGLYFMDLTNLEIYYYLYQSSWNLIELFLF